MQSSEITHLITLGKKGPFTKVHLHETIKGALLQRIHHLLSVEQQIGLNKEANLMSYIHKMVKTDCGYACLNGEK